MAKKIMKTNPENETHAKPRPNMPSLKPTTPMDQMKVDAEQLKKAQQEFIDIQRLLLDVFNNNAGEKALEYLDQYAHKNYPNYKNSNANYAKGGQQEMVQHLRDMIFTAKTKGR